MRVAIDLHCHILPALDDGARDLEDAVAMAKQAQRDGIAAVCATPHIRADHDVRIDELPDRRAELSAAVRAAGCRTHILPGGEVSVDALDGLRDRELAAVSLGGSARWILLEPAAGPLDHRLDRAVESLRRRDLGAVIAHPERHLAPDSIDRLKRLIAQNALVQATAASLLDEGTRDGMLTLARAGVLHVLGSDAHSSHQGRQVALVAALEVLRAAEPAAAHLEWIARTAPRAIVLGRELTAPFGP